MADMLVKLYNIPNSRDIEDNLSGSGIKIKKALAPDRSRILAFAEPVQKMIIPMKCRPLFLIILLPQNFFGPMAVLESERKKGIAL